MSITNTYNIVYLFKYKKSRCAYMDKNILYHGSNVEVPFPRILQNAFYKDFGYGFYCTRFEKQAKRWAMTKKGESIVNLYEYVLNSNFLFNYLSSLILF